MRRFLREVPVGAVIVLLAAASAWAQATAQLDGRVTDESGAVLPGVTVTATQTATTFTRTVVTDATGNYVMTNLPTGPYRLEISLQGFRTYVQTGASSCKLAPRRPSMPRSASAISNRRSPSKQPPRSSTSAARASARSSISSASSSSRCRDAKSPI